MSRRLFASSILATTVALALFGSAGAYEEIAVTDGGTISGTVRFVGPAPKLEPIQVTKDQDTCGKTVPSEVLIVNPQNKGLKNAVVFLEKIEKGKKLEAKGPILDNNKCLFVPHVQAVPVGTRVQCDAHTHMSAWVMAVEHPYFAVTDENGSFKLENIPPGKYKVIAWRRSVRSRRPSGSTSSSTPSWGVPPFS